MRFRRSLKTLAAFAVALMAGLLVVSAASADSGKIKFRGEADVVGVLPGTTTSTFEYKKDGSIKSVSIHTAGESVFAEDLQVECKPASSSACEPLNGSLLFEFHDSDEVLKQVEVVPNPLAPAFLDALAGNLSGDLQGSLAVGDVDPVGLAGQIQMKIHGTAILGCFLGTFPALNPVPVAFCEDKDGVPGPDGGGSLQPIVFDVVDHGKFQLGPGVVGTAVISGGDGGVRAELAGDFSTLTFSGNVIINDATLTIAD